MAAPKHNKNAENGRKFADAIRWALAHFKNNEVKQGEALKHICIKAVEQAINGDKEARAEIANRLDGKPGQAIEATIVHEVPMTFEEAKAVLVKEHGEVAASLLLGEITESEFKDLHESNGTLN